MHKLQETGRDTIPAGKLIYRPFLLTALCGVAVDQLTKFCVFRMLGGEGGRLVLIHRLFSFTCHMNTGTIFGLFQGSNTIFVLLSVVAALAIVIYIITTPGTAPLMNAVFGGMVAAGAVGNLIDRVFLAGVRDFLDFHVWPVFNVADMLICMGAAGLAYAAIRYPEKTQEKESKDAAQD